MSMDNHLDIRYAQQGGRFSLRDALRVLFRHRRKAMVAFAVILTLAVVGLVVAPRTYVSEAKLFVRIGRESVALDPAATVGTTVSLQDSRESEIRSVMDVLQSRVLMEKVVQRLGPDSILHGLDTLDGENQNGHVARSKASGWGLRGVAKRMLAFVIPLDEVSPKEQAVRTLQKSVWVDAAKKSNVISIACKAGSPQLAQKILQTLVDVYRDQHVAVNATESYEFFERQTELLRKELLSATEALGQLKSELGITSIADQRQLLETQLTNLNKDIHDTTAAISASEARLSALRPQVSEEEQEPVSHVAAATTTMAVDQMRDTLYRLQIQEREMRAKYQPEHPALQAIQEQVRGVEQILGRQALLVETAQLATLRARLATLQESLNQTRRQLLQLNQNEVAVSQLERRVELLRNTYQKYSELTEQARVAKALDSEQVTNIKVVQPPSFVAKAASPKPSLVLLLGIFAATFGGLTIAILAECFDHSFQTPEQVESVLHLPVLVAIPRFRRNSLLPSG